MLAGLPKSFYLASWLANKICIILLLLLCYSEFQLAVPPGSAELFFFLDSWLLQNESLSPSLSLSFPLALCFVYTQNPFSSRACIHLQFMHSFKSSHKPNSYWASAPLAKRTEPHCETDGNQGGTGHCPPADSICSSHKEAENIQLAHL